MTPGMREMVDKYGIDTIIDSGIDSKYVFQDTLMSDVGELASIKGIEKEDLSMEENKKILTMLRKNRVYEWVFDEFWNKAIYQECCCFDGYHWYLSLVFEGNRVLNIGGGNDFPDTFVNLAEEVKEFANKDILKLKKVTADVDRFIDYYTANGWMAGKNKMKDWRATARNWDRNQSQDTRVCRQQSAPQQSKIHNFNERQYDYNSMLAELM